MRTDLTPRQRDALVATGSALIDQSAARVIVPAMEPRQGFWFGGGNMIEDTDGTIYLVGRYRNAGDSTTGLAAGTRGLELAIFASNDGGASFSKRLSWTKDDLRCGDREVVSIEGSALLLTETGVELYVSTEKAGIGYPAGLESFKKPETGVWTIDLIRASSIAALESAPVEPLLAGDDPQHLHLKDPVIHRGTNGDTILVFCSHPFSWSSSNSCYAIRRAGSPRFQTPVYGFFGRGNSWDVAATRVTDLLELDGEPIGCEQPHWLAFYDGAESLRAQPENPNAVSRPRGYSCEELGGLAVCRPDRLETMERLSVNLPLFVSPHGTGSSRYTHTLATRHGLIATWQQAQPDGSQPLVLNALSWDRVRRVSAD